MNNDESKVTDAEACRKAAIFLQLFYTVVMVLIGAVLAVLGSLGLYQSNAAGDIVKADDTGKIVSGSVIPWGGNQLDKNSYLAMTIVGVFLLLWGIVSAILTSEMNRQNKVKGYISQALAVGTLFTLNVQGYKFIRMSNGHFSKKQQAKIDKKLAQEKAAEEDAKQQAEANAENEAPTTL